MMAKRFTVTEIPQTRVIPGGQRRIRTSEIHMILNTNRRPRTYSEDLQIDEELRQACREVFRSDDSVMMLMQSLDGQDLDDIVHDLNLTYSIEIGDHPKGRRVHVHTVLKVVHDGRVFVDKRLLWDTFNQTLADQGATSMIRYVKIKGKGDAMGDYLRKGLGPEDF